MAKVGTPLHSPLLSSVFALCALLSFLLYLYTFTNLSSSMKPFGSILEFTSERNADIMRAFRHQLRLAAAAPGPISMFAICDALVGMPAARFWVSDERAAAVVSAMVAGRDLPANMRPTKVAMFSEICRRVVALRPQRPGLSLSAVVSEVIHSPAPCFYMLPRSAMDIIYKIKNGYYDQSFR